MITLKESILSSTKTGYSKFYKPFNEFAKCTTRMEKWINWENFHKSKIKAEAERINHYWLDENPVTAIKRIIDNRDTKETQDVDELANEVCVYINEFIVASKGKVYVSTAHGRPEVRVIRIKYKTKRSGVDLSKPMFNITINK